MEAEDRRLWTFIGIQIWIANPLFPSSMESFALSGSCKHCCQSSWPFDFIFQDDQVTQNKTFLLQAIFMIPTNPPPTFRKPELWSDEFMDFVKQCLVKCPEQRATATQLLQVCWNVKKRKKLNGDIFGLVYPYWENEHTLSIP